MASRRKRSAAVALSAAFLATNVCACSSSQSDYAEVCQETSTQKRADDSKCDKHVAGHSWVYIPRGSTVPPVGSKISSGYSTSKPAGYSVSRGGFGGRTVSGS